MLSSPVYAKLQPRHAPSASSAFSVSSALNPVLSPAFNDPTDQHPNAIQSPSKACHPRALLSSQHRAPLSPLPATLMDHPPSVANKRLTAELTPLDATLTKNRGRGAPYLSLRSTKFRPPLCFHSLTNCPFSIPFVLTFIHVMGGVPPLPGSFQSRTLRRSDAQTFGRSVACRLASPVVHFGPS
jgi:hypothetical protein